jgi:ATP-grasp ribosomal peptide maturase
MPGADGEPTVIVVTRVDDSTADLVIEELNSRRVPVARLDPGDFPTAVTVSATVNPEGLCGNLRTESRTVDLCHVRSVYWRRPSAYVPPGGLAEQDGRWCTEQARYGFGGILAALPGAHYVNHPWRNRNAEHKPAQLATAVQCGLAVPTTLLTNDPARAREFADEHGHVIYKPVWNSDYRGKDGRALTVWVDEVESSSIGRGVRQTVHLFQNCLDKAADIRLTAVGGRFFAVRIDGAPGLDWRRDYEALSYEPIDTPREVAQGVRAYLDAFGLVFGAFDFGLDREGRWWMYECNPNGQWAWFPDDITEKISLAIADELHYAGDRYDH